MVTATAVAEGECIDCVEFSDPAPVKPISSTERTATYMGIVGICEPNHEVERQIRARRTAIFDMEREIKMLEEMLSPRTAGA